MKVYLAGPVAEKTIKEADEWRRQVQYRLKSYNIDFLNPLRGKTEENRNSFNSTEIVLRDKNDIAKSDLVLVYWPKRIISNGTAMEIFYAHSLNIPILFVGEWALKDKWISEHITKCYKVLEDALEDIVEVWMC